MNPLPRIRQELGYPSQAALAAALGVKQQAVSRAERQEVLPEGFQSRVLGLVENKHPDMQDRVLAMLEGGLRWEGPKLAEDAEAVKRDWEPLRYEPIEREAWPWALGFRNQCILDRLAGIAARNGLGCERIRDGLKLTKRFPRRHNRPCDDALFPAPRKFGLKKSGTVVVLGAAYRHYLARSVFAEFTKRLGLDLTIREFSAKPFYPFYFGYQTVLKYLSFQGHVYRPCRYADDEALYYEDYGAILSGPLKLLAEKGDEPFGRHAARLVLVAGLHRLASGVGMRLLEDEDLRASVGGAAEDYDVESDETMRALIYRIVVRHDKFWSSVHALEVLHVFPAFTAG